MSNPISSTPDYTMGFSEEMLESLRRFTAEANAAYLLPYMRPGLRILDLGCGPGNVSVGLAKAVDTLPGRVAGGSGEVGHPGAGPEQCILSCCRCV